MKLYDIGGSGLWTRGSLIGTVERHGASAVADELKRRGITLVISLTRIGEPWLTRRDVLDLQYLHEPMVDTNDKEPRACDLANAHAAARIAAQHIAAGHGDVLVMCRAGRNRTGLVTALTLARLESGWSGLDALYHARTFRPGMCMVKADGSSITDHGFEVYLHGIPNNRGEIGLT